MTRTVIQIHPDPGGNRYFLTLAEPASYPDGGSMYPLAYDPSDKAPADFNNGLPGPQEIGTYLIDKLGAHPAVKKAIDALTGPEGGGPLYVLIDRNAESLPWETLFANQSFLALDRRRPIARMARQAPARTFTFDFQPPLRVFAVLAAAHIDAAAEWAAMYGSLRNAPFPVAINVLVAQDDVRQQIEAVVDPNVRVQVDFVPSGRDLLQRITDFGPAILHFFCHGTTSHGFPQLRIATRSSWTTPGDAGEVVFEPSSLAVDAIRKSLLLAVLNCCRGAQGVEGPGSFAYSLVAADIPAVAAMRQAVSETDAHAFCRGLYRSLVPLLASAGLPGHEVEVELADVMYEPRMEICEEHRGELPCLEAAAASTEWTLPVLYVRPATFSLRLRPPAVAEPVGPAQNPERANIEAQLRTLRSVVDTPSSPIPQAAEQPIRAQIARLESQLYVA